MSRKPASESEVREVERALGDRVDLTPLQAYQHELSEFLERQSEILDDKQRQAALVYTVQRATIVLGYTYESKRG